VGAILHEVSHNLQTDLNLRQVIPRAIAQRLLKAGMSQFVAATWTRWHSEIFADMSGLLLGGPYIVASLMDIAARSPESTLHYILALPTQFRFCAFSSKHYIYSTAWVFPKLLTIIVASGSASTQRAGNIPLESSTHLQSAKSMSG
jgi:hypothetical protein